MYKSRSSAHHPTQTSAARDYLPRRHYALCADGEVGARLWARPRSGLLRRNPRSAEHVFLAIIVGDGFAHLGALALVEAGPDIIPIPAGRGL